jgi:hypothetical protein
MHLRTILSGRTSSAGRGAHARPRRLEAARRPGIFLAVAATGAVAVNLVIGVDPAAQAEATTEPVSVADELGLTARSSAVEPDADLDPLEDLVASRTSREAAETAAQKAQSADYRAELEADRAAKARAEKRAAAKAAAEKAAATKAAAEKAAAPEPAERSQAEEAPAASGTSVSATAHITNTAGPVAGVVQAAADAVVSNVPGASGITLGGTRASATDPGGHPSGLALDYMVLSDGALGDAIVQYHIAHWDELGVEYLIYRQRYLDSPGGSWSTMSDRGSPTANHMDHVHVNYRG